MAKEFPKQMGRREIADYIDSMSLPGVIEDAEKLLKESYVLENVPLSRIFRNPLLILDDALGYLQGLYDKSSIVNARIHPSQISPIVVNENRFFGFRWYNIIDGHHRLESEKQRLSKLISAYVGGGKSIPHQNLDVPAKNPL